MIDDLINECTTVRANLVHIRRMIHRCLMDTRLAHVHVMEVVHNLGASRMVGRPSHSQLHQVDLRCLWNPSTFPPATEHYVSHAFAALCQMGYCDV